MESEDFRNEPESRTHVVELITIGVIASIIGIALGLLIDWFPTQATEEGKQIDTVWDVLIIFSVPVFVLVMVVVLYCVWRFRMRPGEELLDGPPIHGNTRLEIIWTAIPAIVLVALCSYAYVVLHDVEEADANALGVRVVGQQFTWTFYYKDPSGQTFASPQLYVPTGRQVKFTVQSDDVIHDFWVPAFRMKIDAVPGINTRLRVTPETVGEYPVVCAELCGIGHSAMRQTAHVVPPQEFDRWVARRGRPAGQRRSGRRRRRHARRQGVVHRGGLRRLPHARRRRHDRQHRARPRPGAAGQERGVHPAEHRRPERRDRAGLLAGDHAAELRPDHPAGGTGHAREVP